MRHNLEKGYLFYGSAAFKVHEPVCRCDLQEDFLFK